MTLALRQVGEIPRRGVARNGSTPLAVNVALRGLLASLANVDRPARLGLVGKAKPAQHELEAGGHPEDLG